MNGAEVMFLLFGSTGFALMAWRIWVWDREERARELEWRREREWRRAREVLRR